MSADPRGVRPVDAALAYASMGFHVLPVYEMGADGKCACTKDCKSPGKHPRTNQGLKDATTDPTQITTWWKRWPSANVGIATGEQSNAWALDDDPRHGGDVSLAELERTHGALPPTVEAKTGGGGGHHLFRHPGVRIPNRSSLRAGIDVRGDGGYIVVAPSNHASGESYAWQESRAPGEIELADAPDWLLRFVTQSDKDEPKSDDRARKGPASGCRIDDSDAMLEKLRAYAAKTNGAAEGSRNDAAFQLAGNLRALRRKGAQPSERIIESVMRDWSSRCDPPLDDDELRKCIESSAVNGTPPAPKPENQWIDRTSGGDTQADCTPPMTDSGNAERLVRMCGENIRYCSSWKSWLYWDGRRWRDDTSSQVLRYSKQIARSMQDEANEPKDAAIGELMRKWATKSESVERRRAMVTLAACEKGIPIEHTDLDCDPRLLNCLDGTLDLRTGEIRPHRRKDFITKLCPANLNGVAECSVWLRTLERVLPDDDERAYFQRFCGYCLTGIVNEQMFLIAHGDGANGKSTVFVAIQEVLSSAYAIQISSDLLVAKKQRNHPTEVADLFGVRLAIGTETAQEQELDEPLVKQLSGGDIIRARRMREDFWEFAPTHKIVLITNHIPRVRGTDFAMWRRMHFLGFEVRIQPEECDKQLNEKLRRERDGILAWMIEGARQWSTAGLRPPASVLRSPPDLLPSASDRFIADLVARKPGARTSAKRLFDRFGSWCALHEVGVESQTSLGRAMGAAGFGTKKTCGVIVYLDAELTPLKDDTAETEGTVGTVGRAFSEEPPTTLHEEYLAPGGPYYPHPPSNHAGDPEEADVDASDVVQQRAEVAANDAEVVLDGSEWGSV